MRKILQFVSIVCVVLLFGTYSFADEQRTTLEDNSLITKNVSINKVYSILSISSGRAKISVRISGNSRVSKIKANILLQKYSGRSWKIYKSYNANSSGNKLIYSTSCGISKGKYRLKVNWVSWYSGKTESGTSYSSTKSY